MIDDERTVFGTTDLRASRVGVMIGVVGDGSQFIFVKRVDIQRFAIRGVFPPRIIYPEHHRFSWKALDIPQSGKGKLIVFSRRLKAGRLSRAMTPNAIMPETTNRVVKWVFVVIGYVLLRDWIAPKPAVLRSV